jgi:hypothetical protein
MMTMADYDDDDDDWLDDELLRIMDDIVVILALRRRELTERYTNQAIDPTRPQGHWRNGRWFAPYRGDR